MSSVIGVSQPRVRDPIKPKDAQVLIFDAAATASDGVAKLRDLVLLLAVRGKLVSQNAGDESVDCLLARAHLTKGEMIQSGRQKIVTRMRPVNIDEQPFSIPKGWQWVRIGDVCSYVQRGKGPEYAEASAFPVVSQKCVRWSGLDLSKARFVEPASLERYGEERFLKVGDLLWNSTGTGTIGRAVVVPPQTEFPMLVADSHVTVVRPCGVASGFLWRWIQSPDVQAEIEGSASGSTNQIELSTATVIAHPVPLPSLAEQHRIVARVEELMKLCDALEQSGRLADEQHARLTSTLFDALAASESAHALADNWQRIAEHFDLLLDRHEAIDALEQTILQLAALGALTHQVGPGQVVEVGAPGSAAKPVPDGWSIVQFSDVYCELRYGTSTKCGYQQTGTPVLRIPNLQQGRIDTTDLKYGKLEPREVATLRLVAGDLLLIRSNGSASLVGTAALVGAESEGFAFAGYLMRVRLKTERVLPEYVALVLQTSDVRRQIEGPIRTTSGVKNVNSSEIARLTFLLPPIAEQHRIVARVEELRRLCAELRERLTAARRTQTLLADALVRSAQLSQ